MKFVSLFFRKLRALAALNTQSVQLQKLCIQQLEDLMIGLRELLVSNTLTPLKWETLDATVSFCQPVSLRETERMDIFLLKQ